MCHNEGKRIPKLFKVEFQGDKIISLCRKSHCTEKCPESSKPRQVKFSMKGVNKKQFKNPMAHYEHGTTKENFRACNSGILAKDQTMATYKQWKNALTYFYPTRKVLACLVQTLHSQVGNTADGSSTLHLNL